jgi:serine/threonine protein kinase
MTQATNCPKCQNPNPVDAAFCGHCGADLRASAAAPAKTIYGMAPQMAPQPGTAQPAGTLATQPAGTQAATQPAESPSASAAAPPPQVGGRFSVGAPAAQLAIGQLYSGTDSQGGGGVEVLIVPADAFPSPLDIERARRELRQVQKVESVNLLKVHDHGKLDDGRLFVVFEATGGQPLDAFASHGTLAAGDAFKVIKAVGAGLSEAQKVGVIHRDIAPHNIVLLPDGTAKIRGFGLAPALKRNVYGTAEYLSPEQAAGRPVDQRSNIYSLGALLFYLLTGTPPFSGDLDALLEQHQNAEPPLPADRKPDLQLTPKAQQLIGKALAKSSSRRHLTLRQFIRDIDAIESAMAAGGAAVQTPQREKTPTFETPLHGVTSLKGGERPPSSEYNPIATPSPSPADPSLAPTEQSPMPQFQATHNAPDITPAELDQAAAGAASAQAVSAAQGNTVGGEMSGGARVALKQTNEQAPVGGEEQPTPAAAPAAAQPGGKGFRETMWFFKGEIESKMAETGEVTEAPPPETEDLSTKYKDDGSMTTDEAKRLSLRTGKTQMMQAVKVPSGDLPGERMQAEEFVAEMNRSSRTLTWIIIAGVVLAIGGVVAYFVLA